MKWIGLYASFVHIQAKLGQQSWGWWDEWDNTALQTQDANFKPWRSEAEHATSLSRRLPTVLSFTSGSRRNMYVSFKLPRPGNEPRTLAWKAPAQVNNRDVDQLKPVTSFFRYIITRMHLTILHSYIVIAKTTLKSIIRKNIVGAIRSETMI